MLPRILTAILPAFALPGCTATLPSTVIPVASVEDRAAAAGWGTGTWLDQHAAINRIGDVHAARIVFLGDSITQSWGGPGRAVGSPAAGIWKEHFAPRHAVNFGISGDRTQHVLWRIEHGNFDSTSPHTIVLMIGTNNLAHDDADDIALGIITIVDRLHEKMPETTILLCGIVRGASLEDPLRRKADHVNSRIKTLQTRPRVHYIDLPERFYHENGDADSTLVRGDFIHFTTQGYRAWAEAIEAHLPNELSSEPRTPPRSACSPDAE